MSIHRMFIVDASLVILILSWRWRLGLSQGFFRRNWELLAFPGHWHHLSVPSVLRTRGVIDQTTRASHEQTVKQTKLLSVGEIGIIPFTIKWWLNARVNSRKTRTPRPHYFRIWTLDISVSSTITLGPQPGGRGREAKLEWRYFRSRYNRVLRNRTQGNECVRDSVIHIFIEVDKNCFSLGLSWAGSNKIIKVSHFISCEVTLWRIVWTAEQWMCYNFLL